MLLFLTVFENLYMKIIFNLFLVFSSSNSSFSSYILLNSWFIYMCVCPYVYIYTHICVDTHTHTYPGELISLSIHMFKTAHSRLVNPTGVSSLEKTDSYSLNSHWLTVALWGGALWDCSNHASSQVVVPLCRHCLSRHIVKTSLAIWRSVSVKHVV